jgi:hypothetical protein
LEIGLSHRSCEYITAGMLLSLPSLRPWPLRDNRC